MSASTARTGKAAVYDHSEYPLSVYAWAVCAKA
jgi:hypothetical protein